MSPLETWMTLIGMTVITIVTRGFFSLPRRDIPMPGWLRDALRYAPLAALMAVVAPEVLLDHGQLLHSWQAPRLWGRWRPPAGSPGGATSWAPSSAARPSCWCCAWAWAGAADQPPAASSSARVGAGSRRGCS
jgi:branched-subunit amino acid transport protein